MARERYLLNLNDEPAFQRTARELTPEEKRKNWWHYHKVMVILCVALALIAGSLIWSIVGQIEPDYSIGLATSFTMPQSGMEEMERVIAQYADDRNGDGRIKVTVVNYVMPNHTPGNSEEATRMEVSMARFVADFASNESMIFFYDEGAFQSLEDDLAGVFQYLDGTPMSETATDFENARIKWEDCAGLKDFVPRVEDDISFDSEMMLKLYRRLFMSVRTAEGTSIEKSEKDMAYQAASVTLSEKLISGELPEKPEGGK